MTNPTIEAGVFVGFVLVAFAGIIFITRLPYLLILSGVIFSGLSLLMFGYYDVVWTKVVNIQTQNEVVRNATGAIVTNSTTTIPQHTEYTPIINSDHDTWGWIFMAMAIGCTFFFFRVKL